MLLSVVFGPTEPPTAMQVVKMLCLHLHGRSPSALSKDLSIFTVYGVRCCKVLSFNSCVVDFTYQHVAASCSLCGRRGWCLLRRRGQAGTYVHWCGQCLSQKLGYIAWCWTSPAEFLSGVFRTRLNCWRQELALPLPNVAMQAHC